MQNSRISAKNLFKNNLQKSQEEVFSMWQVTDTARRYRGCAQEDMTYFEAVPDNILGCMWVVGCQDPGKLLFQLLRERNAKRVIREVTSRGSL